MLIPGNEGGAQGPGYARVTSTTSLSISAADPTNNRVDLCCATMSDAQYTEPTGGSGSQWALQVLTGTPTSGASLSNLSGAPSLPGSSLLLGYVLVPAGATSIVSGDIANKATVVLPAALPAFGVVSLSGQTRQITFRTLSGTSSSLTAGWQTYSYSFTAFPTTCLGAFGVIGPVSNGTDVSAWNYAGFTNGTITFNLNPTTTDTFRLSGLAWGY